MAEFTYNAVQTVNYNEGAVLETTIACPNGYVRLDPGTGTIILRGVSNNPCARFARYFIIAGSNIAIPTGGTIGEISQSLALAGTPIQPSKAATTPTAVAQFNNVTSFRYIDVPIGCCYFFSVENTSETAAPILMRNLNVSISRVA